MNYDLPESTDYQTKTQYLVLVLHHFYSGRDLEEMLSDEGHPILYALARAFKLNTESVRVTLRQVHTDMERLR